MQHVVKYKDYRHSGRLESVEGKEEMWVVKLYPRPKTPDSNA
jgi:hypothetical protein